MRLILPCDKGRGLREYELPWIRPPGSWDDMTEAAESVKLKKGEKMNLATYNTKDREKLEIPISTRLSPTRFRTLESWCDFSFRKRSELVAIVLERVLEILEEQPTTDQPVEHFVRRLHLDSR